MAFLDNIDILKQATTISSTVVSILRIIILTSSHWTLDIFVCRHRL